MDELRLRVSLGLGKLGNINKNNKSLAPSVNPNQKERIAAAALLFLSPPSSRPSLSLSSSSSSSTFSIRDSTLKEEEEEETSSSSCISDACSSSTPAAAPHLIFFSPTELELDQIHGDPLRLLSLAADRASLRPKLVKKVRSKIQQKTRQIKEIYNMRVVYDLLNSKESKDQDDEAPAVFSLPSTTAAADAASSVTAVTSTTRRSSSRPVSTKKDKNASLSSSSTTTRSKASGNIGSKSVKRRADAIIDWLSGNGCASEVKIRSVVGDSPDTSKALRLLVKKAEVKRTGAGGRTDPFLYTVASKGSTQS